MTHDVSAVLPHSYHALRERVFQSLGAASMCWESLDQAGVFLRERALEIGEQLINDIVGITNFGEPSVGLATSEQLLEELGSRIMLSKFGADANLSSLLTDDNVIRRDQFHTYERDGAVGPVALWQHNFFPWIFSTDAGVTYYSLDEDVDQEGNPHTYTSKEPTHA